MIRLLSLVVLPTVLAAGCRPRALRPIDRSGYENPIGAAVVYQLVREASEAYADVPEIKFALVIAERLAPAAPAFVKQFRDAGHAFVGYHDVSYDDVTKASVIKGTRSPVVVLQLAKIAQMDPQTYEVEAAWNRNRDVVKKVYQVKGDRDSAQLVVTELRVLRDDRYAGC